MLSDEQIGEIVAKYSYLGITNWGKVIRVIESAARAQALEDAAKVCEARYNRLLNSTRIVSPVVAMAECAASIRALADQAGKGEA